MIEFYLLSELLKKYNINPEKILSKNDNILAYGFYHQIDMILDYLINKLHFSVKNIEKCPFFISRSPHRYIQYRTARAARRVPRPGGQIARRNRPGSCRLHQNYRRPYSPFPQKYAPIAAHAYRKIARCARLL